MKKTEFKEALRILEWTHPYAATVLGVSLRQTFRWTSGASPVPHATAALVRMLVKTKLTKSERQFQEQLEEIR